MKSIFSILLVCFAAIGASAAGFDATKVKLEQALEADIRTADEKARDRNRKPLETLEFYGLRDDMRVVELIPGGGWYTKLLAPVLRDKGKFYVGIGADRAMQRLGQLEGFDKVDVVAKEAAIHRPDGARLLDLSVDSLDVENVDIVFTFRNYHNFSETGRAAMNQVAYAALKPGGVYAVVDHTRRHMESDSGENRRRIDPVLAIQEIQAAGFVFEQFSDLHFRTDDELRYEVGRRSVAGNTDRWTLKFRKPE